MEAPFFRDFLGNRSFLNKQGQGSFDQEAAGRVGGVPLGQDEEQHNALNMQLLQNQQRVEQLAYHHSLMQMQHLLARQAETPPAPYPYHYYGGSATMQDMETGGELVTGGLGSHNAAAFSLASNLNGLSVSQGFGNTFLPEQNQRPEWQGSSNQSLHTQMAHSYMINNYTSAGSDSLLMNPRLEQPGYYRIAKTPSDLNESRKSFLGSHNVQYETVGGRQNMEHSAWPIHSIRESHNPEKINFMSNNRQQLQNLMTEQQAYFSGSAKDSGRLEVLPKFHCEQSRPESLMRMQSQNVIVYQPTPSAVPRGLAASEKQDFEYRSYEQGQLSRDSGQIVDREMTTPGRKEQRYWQSRNPGLSYQLSGTLAGMQDSSSSPIYSNNGKMGLVNTIDPNWPEQQAEESNKGLHWGQQTCSELRSPQIMHSEAMDRDGQQNLLANSAGNESHGSAKRMSYFRMLFDDLEDNEELNPQPEISVVDQQSAHELQSRDVSTLAQTNPQSSILTGGVMNASALNKLDNSTVYHPSEESRLKRIRMEPKESHLKELPALMAPSSMPHWQPHPTGDAFRQESRIDAGYGRPTLSFADNAGESSIRNSGTCVEKSFTLFDSAANSTVSVDNGLAKQAHSNEFLMTQLSGPEKGSLSQSPSIHFHSREGNEAEGVPEQAKTSAIPHPLGPSSPRNFGLQLALPRSPSLNPQQGISPMWHSESVSRVRSEMSGVNNSQQGWPYERDTSNGRSRMDREGVSASAFSFVVPDSRLQMKHPSLPVSYGWQQYPTMEYTRLCGGSRDRDREDGNFASLPQENSSVITHSPSPTHNHEQMVHPEGFGNVMQRSGMPALDSKGGSIESWTVTQRVQNVHASTSKEEEAYEGVSRLGGERISNYLGQSLDNELGVSRPEVSFELGNTNQLNCNESPTNSNSVMPISSSSQGIPDLAYQADDAKVSKQNDGYFRELNVFRRSGNNPSVVTTASTTSNNFETLSSAQTPPLLFQGTTPLPHLVNKLSNGGVSLSSLSLRQQAHISEQARLKDLSTKQDSCFHIRSGEAFEDRPRPQLVSQPDPASLLRQNEKRFKQSLDSDRSYEEGLSKSAMEYKQIRPPSGNFSSQMKIGRLPEYQSASKSALSDVGRTTLRGNAHEHFVMARATVDIYNESIQQSHLVETPLQYPSKISQRARGSEEFAVVASASNNTLAPESRPCNENQKLPILSQKKRKRTSSLAIPWHLAIKQPLDHLGPPRASEPTWAASTNRLPEKDVVEVEWHTSTHRWSNAMRRLKLTTEMVQQIVPLLPVSLMHGIRGRDYESITYTLSKVSLEETCRLVSRAQVHTKHQRKQIHTASMCLNSHFELDGHGVLEHSLTNLFKRLTEDVKRLESELVRLESSSSALELVKELQDVDKVGIVNRLSKHHGGRSFLLASMDHCNKNAPEHSTVLGGHRQSPERYVIAWPMPRIIPELASCFSL